MTIVTNDRRPLLASAENVAHIRSAMKQVMEELPFEIPAAVILPDHIHFLWSLPRGDTNYSARVGRMKILFTRSMRENGYLPEAISDSRRKHRESGIWQRRFWEHAVKDEEDFERYLDYIHYNPVKHGCVKCPHLWKFSSFQKWVDAGLYPEDWGCACHERISATPTKIDLSLEAGE